MADIDTSRMRPGVRVLVDGEPYAIAHYQHVKPGKGGAFVRLKLKHLRTGAVIDRTLKSGDKLPEADVALRQLQYLYRAGAQLVFMDGATYDQVELPAESVDGADLLQESCEVTGVIHDGRPIAIELPPFVVLEVSETGPAEKADKLKPATLETGAVVQVPGFVVRGDRLRIDTRTRAYVERA
jgi:elongation factor P